MYIKHEMKTQTIQFLSNYIDNESNEIEDIIYNEYLGQLRNNMNKKIIQILSNMPLPNYATFEDLKNYIISEIMNEIKSNNEFYNILKNIFNNNFKITQFLIDYEKLIDLAIKQGENDIYSLTKEFFESNFDYNIFTSLMQGILLINEKLQTIKEKTSQSITKIKSSIKSKRHFKYINELTRDIELIFKDIDEISTQIIKIELYIDLFNSNSLLEVFSHKFYDIEKLNKQYLIDEIDKLNKIIEENHIQKKSLDKFKDDPTAKLFSDLIETVM